jgi:hypothetical protein
VLAAFFDDSGTHASSPVVAMGGLLGTEEEWGFFGAAWDELLKCPLPGKSRLGQFHLSPCRATEGEFRLYTLAERDLVTNLFRQVILDTGLVTLAAAVNRVAWDELVTEGIAEQLGPPEQLCFFKCIELVVNTIRLRKPGHKARRADWSRRRNPPFRTASLTRRDSAVPHRDHALRQADL